MLVASSLLTSTFVFFLLACVSVAIGARKINHSLPSLALGVGGVAMLVAAYIGWNGDFVWIIPAPLFLAMMPFTYRLDSLSSIFVGLLGFVSLAVSLYSPGYLKHLAKTTNSACYWVELFCFVSGMLGVILSANALSFLVWWEVMALSSLLLIATNLVSHESRRAAFIYLGATRIATALLMAGFIWMHVIFNSWDFSAWTFAGRETLVPALMIFFGFCIKAGIWPFQDWLPHAHPAAPAPVSALMSGVMIEIALYAMLRILIMGGLISPYIAYIMIGLGVISAFWGILLAFLQKDLKVLLAYSSIENVGLILIALGVAVISASMQLPVVSSFGIAAAVYHCVNHGFFKSLLFLGAGAVDAQAHTRNLEECGGLGQRMPWTMVSFVIGSAAICGIPSLNGFNSKWLLYQSLFQLANMSASFWLGGLSIICIGALGLVSGLTIATFAKAIGIAFLGRPRSVAAEKAVEVPLSMRVAQGLLVALCIVFGFGAQPALMMLKPVCLAAKTGGLLNFPIPIGTFAVGVCCFTAFVYFFWLNMGKPGIQKFITWECGFGDLNGKMQTSSAGFSENVAHTFAPVLEYHLDSTVTGPYPRHFPDSISTKVVTDSLLESRLYGPAVRSITWLGEHMLLLQAGSVHLYLVYILVTLVALMLVGILT
jgi:formate hydrogenlyase subunit 3/multisubunit Na+/H+ antiporter MnhD subunit